MTERSSLGTLIGLASSGVEKAHKQLQDLMNTRHNAELQLSTLLTYREDYAQRLQKAAQAGLTASNYHNFRQFIVTLDEAILQQNKVVAQIDTKLENGRRHWFSEKRRLGSFEALMARQALQARLRENRNEQRASDERSASQLRRTWSSH